MENLINENEFATVNDPVAEYERMRQELKQGNPDTIARFSRGEYRDLQAAYQNAVNGTHQTVDEQQEEPDHTAPLEMPVDNSDHVEADPDDTPVDPIEENRRLLDMEHARFKAEQEALRLEMESRIEAERLEKQRLLKELEDERKKADERLSFFDDSEPLEDASSVDVETPKKEENRNSYADLPPDVRSRLERVEQIERQLAEKQEWDDTVRTYSRFFNSPEGEKFKPQGDLESNMREFNEFYGELVSGLGNDKDAIRLLYDIRKGRANDDILNKTGATKPREFERMYDAFEVALFAEGYTIDPTLGRKVPHNKGKFANLEDAYYILHKDEIRKQEKLNAYKDVQNKLRQRDSAAVTIEPTNYRPMDNGVSKWSDRNYRTEILTRAREAGWKGDGNINAIRDEGLRNELSQLMAILNKK